MTGLALGFMMQTVLLAAGPQTYDEAYKQAETNGQPILVLVGADWCPGCRTMKAGVLPKLQAGGKLKGINFAQVNTDESATLAGHLMRGNSIPQLIVYAKTEKGWQPMSKDHPRRFSGSAPMSLTTLRKRPSASPPPDTG